MKKFHILFSFVLLFSISLDARKEVVLTLPKSGTHYLKKILEHIDECNVLAPTTPSWFHQAYALYAADPQIIVMGHCEPLVMHLLPESERVLLLIRDPRDLALSAVDYIDNNGLAVWPGLQKVLNERQWEVLSKKEKLSLILDGYYDERRASVFNFYETAIRLLRRNDCVVIKYEALSPECNSSEALEETVQSIGCFFGVSIDSYSAEKIVRSSFKNSTSQTLHVGKSFRYKDENREIIEYLESKLSKYIRYFKYSFSAFSEKEVFFDKTENHEALLTKNSI